MIYIISYSIGWIISIIYNWLNPSQSFVYNTCLVQLVFTVGFFCIFNFIGHVILREKVAKTIGWVSNGFQVELGLVSLGIGILCYWIRDSFWIATVIPFTTFLFGAAILHIKEIIKQKNFNPGNVIIVIPDIIMPLTIIILLLLK
ncbi:DUF6790 family protein [Clostridium butyricum]|uniref:DUF6790 family protein n=1 Tax=Clostridium butyricum TaxID=1492 RepID=UPI0018AB1BAA|nr:DUF6790 family protein [Clostridium butyricum]